MVELAGASIAALLVITVLQNRIDLRVYGSEHISVAISLTYISINLSNLSKNKRKRKLRFAKRLRIVAFLLKLGKELVKRSAVTVDAINPPSGQMLRSDYLLTAAALGAPAVMVYLKSNARSYEVLKRTGYDIDVSVSFSLTSLFISFFKASYYTVKSRLKGRIRNA